MNTAELIKPIITPHSPGDPRKLCSLKILNNKAGELSLDVQKESQETSYHFISVLKNKFGKKLGTESFTLWPDNDSATGLYIRVNPEYRRNPDNANNFPKYFFGEILRLTSIIEIMENKLKNFIIHSKNTAIYFHSKYKFKPAITAFEERNQALTAIIKNKTAGYEEIVSKAEELLKIAQSDNSGETQRRLCVDTNKLLEEYITKVLSEKDGVKHHPFNWGMQMVLTDKSIINNREFFNNLFRKHGIDYTL